MKSRSDIIVVVRGGGDLATGVVQKFFRAGYKVVVLEIEKPLAIRRTVSLCTAVYAGSYKVEDMTARLAKSPEKCHEIWQRGEIPILIDREARLAKQLKPDILIDAIIAKRNIGTNKDMASITIALGPGFIAGVDVDVVVETKRGHDLGQLYFDGMAISNTGKPGDIEGYSRDRVVYSNCDGISKHVKDIGDVINKGEVILMIDETPVTSPINGVLRGVIAEGLFLRKGTKCADVDPRSAREFNCYTISDKARAVGGGALEGALMLSKRKEFCNGF